MPEKWCIVTARVFGGRNGMKKKKGVEVRFIYLFYF